MTTPPSDAERMLLELLNLLTKGQKSHTAISRNTNEVVHGLNRLLPLVEPEGQHGPGGETAQGLVQTLIDQIASLEAAQNRTAALMLSETRYQTSLLEQMARQLGVRLSPLSTSA